MIKINGENKNLENINLLEYLIKNNYPLDKLVVEHNEKIIKKADYKNITLKDKDKVEIISFVGGG